MGKDLIQIYLEKTDRIFAFPCRVKSIGYFNGNFIQEEEYLQDGKRDYGCFRDEYQISLRLTAPVQTLRQNINGTVYENQFPHVILKCPGETYSNNSAYVSLNSLCIHYSREAFQSFFDRYFNSGPLAWNVTLTPRITRLLHDIVENLASSQNFSVADRLDIQAFQLLEELLLFRMDQREIHSSQIHCIQKIASYIQLNYYKMIDIDSLVAANGMSRSTFFRQWNQLYHETPLSYLRRLRMEEAGRLLLETDSSLQSISMLLGFSSPAYFCSVFKKYYSCTPHAFRFGQKQA